MNGISGNHSPLDRQGVVCDRLRHAFQASDDVAWQVVQRG